MDKNKPTTIPNISDFIEGVQPDEIPIKYIESVQIYYHSGVIVTLTKSEINNPLPSNPCPDEQKISKLFKEVAEVKVYISLEILEQDVHSLLSKYIGHID